MTELLSLPAIEKPSRKAIAQKIKAEKAQAKIEHKAALRRKTEKKLAEKAERKVAHKKANAQRKFDKKIAVKIKK